MVLKAGDSFKFILKKDKSRYWITRIIEYSNSRNIKVKTVAATDKDVATIGSITFTSRGFFTEDGCVYCVKLPNHRDTKLGKILYGN